MLPGRNYTPEDIISILWSRKWLLISGLVFFTVLAVAISLRIPNQYQSETLILVIPQRIPESYVRSTVTTRIEDRLRSIGQEILSRTRLERIIIDFNLYPNERKAEPMEVVVARMRPNINVEPVRDDAFKISFTAPDARTAMIVTDRLASMYINENSNDRAAMAAGTNQFLQTELEAARQRLLASEKKLEEFRTRNAGELPSQLQTNLQVIQGNQSQIQNLNESINRDRDRRLLLEKSAAAALAGDAVPSPPSETGASGAAAAPAESRSVSQLEKARNDLSTLELRYRPEHPDVMAKKRLIADLERKVEQEAFTTSASASTDLPAVKPISTAELIRQARAREYQVEIEKVDRQLAAKEAEVARLAKAISDYQRRVEAVPGHESELTDLMRDYDVLKAGYASLLTKKEDSKISSNLESQQVAEQFKILDPARLPEKPISPDRVRFALIGAVFGLGLGLGLAAFLEYRDTTLRSEDEILRTLVLPVLAAVPVMVAVADRQRRRRLLIASIAVSVLTAVSVAAVTVWHFDLLRAIR
jgi:polysaccharide chain length determinant protein (PEP-CTERM system associated)